MAFGCRLFLVLSHSFIHSSFDPFQQPWWIKETRPGSSPLYKDPGPESQDCCSRPWCKWASSQRLACFQSCSQSVAATHSSAYYDLTSRQRALGQTVLHWVALKGFKSWKIVHFFDQVDKDLHCLSHCVWALKLLHMTRRVTVPTYSLYTRRIPSLGILSMGSVNQSSEARWARLPDGHN